MPSRTRDVAAQETAVVQRITGPRRAGELAANLNSGSRARPAVVVSIPRGAEGPWIDVDRLAGEVGDYVDVHLLTHGCTWEFAAAMPPGTQVYGGAGRVYPVGVGWVQDLGRSPLRLVYTATEALAATDALIEDSLMAANSAGLLAEDRRPSGAAEIEGVVVGCPTSSQAMVQLNAGTYCVVQTGVAVPGVASTRILARGMRVRGILDTWAGRLDIRPFLPGAADRLCELDDDAVVPARVETIAQDTCYIALYPGLLHRLSRQDVTDNADDDLRDLLSPGEIVAVRITRGVADRGRPARIRLAGPGAPVGPALSILPGGPPWLDPPRLDELATVHGPPISSQSPAPTASPESADVPDTVGGASTAAELGRVQALPLGQTRRIPDDPGTDVASQATNTVTQPPPTPLLLAAGPRLHPARAAPPPGASVRSMSLTLDAARSREAVLRDELHTATADLNLLRVETQQLQRDLAQRAQEMSRRDEELRRLRRRHRMSQQDRRTTPSWSRTDDPGDALRLEVYASWIRRFGVGERDTRPLKQYALGPQFLQSLEDVQGISRAKVIDVIVEILTGVADTMPSRGIHPLRSGGGGDDATVRRDVDGATCWRVWLQQNAAAARRLHFWRVNDSIELSRVVLHDDMNP